MGIVVMKFGGTSVADAVKIRAAAQKAIDEHNRGNQVVVVVSAMGKATDHLEKLALEVTPNPPAREKDLLLSIGEQQTVALMSMAIDDLGGKPYGVSGNQLGIETDSKHNRARILSINTKRICGELEKGKIVVAAGFQGIDKDNNITTLGRGGSDTTAVALAASLGARCDIYTDVDGVYTIDPRRVPTSRKVEQVSYDEMLELASLGAGVLHSRSVEFAKKFRVPVQVRSSMRDVSGTKMGADPEALDQPVCGMAVVNEEARVTMLGVRDTPGNALKIFSSIADADITVDMVVQNRGNNDTADISFTVLKQDLNRTLRLTQSLVEELGAERVNFDEDVSKISVVGLGMEYLPGVASRMFRALADANINIIMISTSVIKISVLVESRKARAALWAVHQEFELDKAPTNRTLKDNCSGEAPNRNIDSEALRQELELAINEDLAFEKPKCDETQGLITISGVPDQPGFTANVFEGIAEAGIVVDMIVQGASKHGAADLSFTVKRDELERAREEANRISEKLGAGPVSESASIDILSVAGVGLRTHTGVAIPMFRALAGQDPEGKGINVRLINTSEVNVSVVVSGDGKEGLQRLEKVLARDYAK